MSYLKSYLLNFYNNVEDAAEDIGVSRSTLYYWLNSAPEQILSHLPRLLANGKAALFAKDQSQTILSEVFKDYLEIQKKLNKRNEGAS